MSWLWIVSHNCGSVKLVDLGPTIINNQTLQNVYVLCTVKVVGVVVVVAAVEIDTYKTCKDLLKVYHHVFCYFFVRVVIKMSIYFMYGVHNIATMYLYFLTPTTAVLRLFRDTESRYMFIWMNQWVVKFYAYADICAYCHIYMLP